MDQEVNRVLRKKFENKNYEALNPDEKREYDQIVAFYDKRKKQIPGLSSEPPVNSPKANDQTDVPELIEAMGIKTATGINYIFPGSTRLPASCAQMFSTVADNQSELEIQLFTGNLKNKSGTRHLITFTLTGIRQAPKGVPQILVTFRIDKMGLVTAQAKDIKTNTTVLFKDSGVSVRMGWQLQAIDGTLRPSSSPPSPIAQQVSHEPKPVNQPINPGDQKKSAPAVSPPKSQREVVPKTEEPPFSFDLSNRTNEILLKTARPDIYRVNAFRVLEIPVNTSTREAKNQMRKLDMKEKLGSDGIGDRGLLPLIPAPDADARREANQRLENPETRLIDELFWFWPLTIGLSGENDEALVALKRSDFSTAIAIWKNHETNASESNVSMHNLAIMYHVLALDIEQIQLTTTISQKQSQQKREYWEQAFFRWKVLLNHEGFWSRVTNRIRETDDPRLTTGVARRLQNGLPIVLLNINAILAVRNSQRGNTSEATYHIDLIQKSGFSKQAIDEALKQAISPVRDRIKVFTANAEAESKKDPTKGDEAVRVLIQQATPFLDTLDLLLSKGHVARDASHDEVAAMMLQITIAFCNKTNNMVVTQALMEQALNIAASASIRQRIEQNMETNKGNMVLGICWYCKKNPADESSAVAVKMHGEVTRTRTYRGTNIQWRKMDIKVPRCKECKSIHEKKSNKQGVWGGLGILAGIILAILVGTLTKSGWAAFFVLVGCTTAGFVIPAVTQPKTLGIKEYSYWGEFPQIKRQQAQGWAFGEKPSDAH
jgi:hypothetical protein